MLVVLPLRGVEIVSSCRAKLPGSACLPLLVASSKSAVSTEAPGR